MYQLLCLPGAKHYFKKLTDKRLKEAFRDALSRIAENPFIGERKSGDLSGLYGLDVYDHGTNYEIAYRIYRERGVVVVILAGTRENFYKELKHYMKNAPDTGAGA